MPPAKRDSSEPLRVALLSYRSKPHCGGQGIYVRHLSRELVGLGHTVHVFSGQPYPVLDDGVVLEKVPSLDLYNDTDPFRAPPIREWRDWIDVLEVAGMWTAGFPEPLTFSLRALRELRRRTGEFDIVHDNQTLGYGMLGINRLSAPLVTTIHHPISVDRRIELDAARGFQRWSKRRWYGFVSMQRRVARRLAPILVPSTSSANDVTREFGVARSRLDVVPLGVDTSVFHPRPAPREPGHIVCVASADSPLKGVATLLRATAKVATERDVSLTIVGRPRSDGPTAQLAEELSLGDIVRFEHGLSDGELGRLLAGAEIAVVPSFYEGFSLPAVEAMASGTPLIASRAGALPEVGGDAVRFVSPGDAEELAQQMLALLGNPQARDALSAAGLARVRERFTWRAVAEATAQMYRESLADVATDPLPV